MPKRASLAASVGLALLLALGLGAAWAAVVAWCGSVVDDWLKRDNEYRYVQVLVDGTPVVIAQSRSDYSGQVVRTLDGKKVPAEDRIGMLEPNSLPGLREYSRTPRSLPWDKRLSLLSDRRDPPAYWVFVHNGEWEGGGYFVGYDSKSKLRIGYLGTAGFRDAPPPSEERFDMDGRAFACQRALTGAFIYYSQLYYAYEFQGQPGACVPPWAGFMISGERILRFDLRQGTVDKIMDLPGAFAVGMATRASPLDLERKRPALGTPRPLFLTIRTADHLVIADPNGRELERYALPEPIRNERVGFYLLNDHMVLANVSRQREGDGVAEFLWFDPSGRIARREEVLLSEASILGKPAAEKWAISACVPAPIGVAGAVAKRVFEESPDAGWSTALGRAWTETWPAFATVSLLGACLAALCYRRQKRYALPGTAVWVAFVFLTGLPGLLGYLYHRRWPVLEPCPGCTKPSPRDREACAQCGTEFPRPAPKGVEVFA